VGTGSLTKVKGSSFIRELERFEKSQLGIDKRCDVTEEESAGKKKQNQCKEQPGIFRRITFGVAMQLPEIALECRP